MKRSGFTLIELLLYSALAAVILASVAALLFFIVSARIKARTVLETDEDGRRIIRIMNRAIRSAESINIPATSTAGPTLSLALAEVAKNPTIFDVLSGVLRIQEGTSTPPVALTSTSTVIVSDFRVYNLTRSGTPGAIEFQFTLSHQNPSGRNEYGHTRRFLGGAALRWP